MEEGEEKKKTPGHQSLDIYIFAQCILCDNKYKQALNLPSPKNKKLRRSYMLNY